MNTAELDEWFGRAEDVLTDWAGSADAMNTGSDDATVSEGGVDVFEITPEISAFRAAFSDPLVLRGAVTDLTGVVTNLTGMVTGHGSGGYGLMQWTPAARRLIDPTVDTAADPGWPGTEYEGTWPPAEREEIERSEPAGCPPQLFVLPLPAYRWLFEASWATREIASWWDHADLRARALEARRSRNTGPPQQRRLDGKRARR